MRKLALWALAAGVFGGAVSAGEAAAEERERFKSAGAVFEVERIRDIPYRNGDGADPVKHKLDLYLPRGVKGFPVLFFVHGGAWRSGDKRLYGMLGETFAGMGVGSVIINYRLSPKVRHPEHVKDVARAFAWTYRNIARYGGRPDRIFASGHSAGGHLVALLATDETYLKAEELTAEALRGVIPMSGVYSVLPDALFQSVFGEDRAARRKAFPINHVHNGLPPFLILYAEKDLLTIDKMSVQFYRKLCGAECRAKVMEVKDRNHITIIVGLMVPTDPATQAILDFIRTYAELPTPEAGDAGGDGDRADD
ncbi:MAG TPA: alpha/beta hydrolase [Gemmataceae bacterium]